MILGVLTVEAWPGRWSQIFSAISAAAAVTIRPHVVVLLPAIVVALNSATYDSTDCSRLRVQIWRRWGLAFGVFLLSWICAIDF